MFTIETGNFTYQFVSVLGDVETGQGGMGVLYLQQIGARGVRVFDGLRQTKNGIEVFGFEYGPSDSVANPTVPCSYYIKCVKGLYSVERPPSRR